mgnify:CR=1 FL=1
MKVQDSLDSYDLIDQTDKRKDCASTWFLQLRDRLCAVFEDIESELATIKITYNLRAQCQDYGVKKLLAAKGVGLVFLPEIAMKMFKLNTNLIKIGSFTNIVEKFGQFMENLWTKLQKYPLRCPPPKPPSREFRKAPGSAELTCFCAPTFPS